MDLEDKLSIKNILFTKSLANHEIPAPVDGHKIFPCIDCGDKFVFESSYEDHLNRKSIQITYMCRFCNQTKVFFNRCKLLFHIRSHAFKTATINVNDLKVEPIPLSFYKTKPIQKPNQVIDLSNYKKTQNNVYCYECKQHIIPTNPAAAFKNRANHFMQFTNEVHTCPVCLFTLPTICGLRAHLRFHLNRPPFFCPECGIHLPGKKIQYPYGHDCEGFKMMRATTRVKCPVLNCHLYHPNDIKEHMKESHLKKVFKCSYCVVACFSEATMNGHLRAHNIPEAKAMIFYQCDLCPGRLVVQSNLETHLKIHISASIYPCWACGGTYKDVSSLIGHHIQKHPTNITDAMKNLVSMKNSFGNQNVKRIYRVVKRCDHCKRNFTYKCNFNEIGVLPSECPYKCLSKSKSTETLTCFMCKEKISEDWKEIKKHYAKNHKMHKCIDPRVILQKINVSKYKVIKKRTRKTNTAKKRQNKVANKDTKVIDEKSLENYCTICKRTCNNKEELELHFISHKDPCAAYQCMECGQSFIVKPSFSTHLMIEHGVSNVDEYISKKRCYNENALEKYQNTNISFEPLKENQCRICREQFENAEDLAKHFRGHGMAFLLKSTNKNA